MPRIRNLIVFLIASLAILTITTTDSVRASVSELYVDSGFGEDEGRCRDPSRPCQGIDYALGKSRPGDTIKVAEGEYTGPLAVTKSVTLLGGFESGTWRPCFNVCGNDCASTIDGSGTPSGGLPLVDIQEVSHGAVTIDGFTITGAKEGAIRARQSSIILRNTRIVSNTHSWVSGLSLTDSRATIERSIIAQNLNTTGGGGVILLAYASSVEIEHSSIVDNRCSAEGCPAGLLAPPNATVIVRNSILWGHNGEDIRFYPGPLGGKCRIEYSDIEMGLPTDCTGTEVISEEPGFVDQANGDYRLKFGSACINTGDPTSPLDPDGSRTDMGACVFDQRIPTPSPTNTLTSTPTWTPTPTATVTPPPTLTPALRYLPYLSKHGVLRSPLASGSLRGVAYGPFRDGQNPDRGIFPSQADLRADMLLLGRISNGIRTYSATNGLELIPHLAQEFYLPVAIGAWLDADSSANRREFNGAIAAACKHKNVTHVVLGNERLWFGRLRLDDLLAFINESKGRLSACGRDEVIVTTAEPWPVWGSPANQRLVEAVESMFVHVHPYWEGKCIEDAVAYVRARYLDLQTLYPQKPIVIGETGWPSAGTTQGCAVPSLENQRRFVDDLLAWTAQGGVDVFLFEAFDERWKCERGRDVECHWGLLYSDRTPKPALLGLLDP